MKKTNQSVYQKICTKNAYQNDRLAWQTDNLDKMASMINHKIHFKGHKIELSNVRFGVNLKKLWLFEVLAFTCENNWIKG